MVIDTSTDVEQLQSVETPSGSRSQPANADLQRESARGFSRGDSFDTASYPVSVTPDATISDILLPVVTSEIAVTLTLTSGDTVTIPVTGPATIDSYRVSSFEITDPNNTGSRVAGSWAGE